MNRLHRSLALILVFALFLPILATGCGDNRTVNSGNRDKDKPKPTEPAVVSPEDPVLKSSNNVTVNFGEAFLDEELTVNISEKQVETNTDYGSKAEIYDIDAGDLKQFDNYVEIRLPYDASYFDEGADPALCINTRWLNEDTGEWESIYSELDEATQEVIIYSDHFSKFGVFYVENEGERMAKAWSYSSFSYYDFNADEMVAAAQAIKNEDKDTLLEMGAKLVNDRVEKILAGNETWGNFKSITDLATLGNSEFSTKFIADFDEALSNMAEYLFAVKAVHMGAKGNASDQDKLNIIWEGAQVLINKFASGHAGLSFSMAAIWVLDKINTKIFETGRDIKRSNIYAVYEYFNDNLRLNEQGHTWVARRAPQWRQILIDIIETPNADGSIKTQEEVQEALAAEIDDYSRIFWSKFGQDFWYDAASEAGYKRVPVPDESDREALTAQYKKDLMYRFENTIFPAVERYYSIKAQQAYEAQLDKTMAIYNRVTQIKLKEDLEDGKESKYAGCTWLFADLAEGIDAKEWSGTVLSTGETSIPVRMIAFLMAGRPTTIKLFAKGDDIETATPIAEFSYKFDYPEVEINLAGGPSFADLVGDYSDGTMTVVDFNFSQEYIDNWEEPDPDEDVEGCDLSGISPEDYEQIKGMPLDQPFRITAIEGEENAGMFKMVDEEEEAVRCEYDPGTMTLVVDFITEGRLTPYHYTVTYNADRTRVTLEAEETIQLVENDLSTVTIHLKGSKAVPPPEGVPAGTETP